MFRELAANLTLIVLAGLGYGALLRLRRLGPRARRVAEGGFFALVGLAGMQFPVVLEKGLIFDGRSVALSVAGLFCGWEGAAAAAIPVALARLFMDGPGAVAGAGVALSSAAMGAGFRALIRRLPSAGRLWGVWLFGLAVHLVMMGWMLLFPGGHGWAAVRAIALPVLALYPGATVLLAALLREQEQLIGLELKLKEREEETKGFFRAAPAGAGIVKRRVFFEINERFCRMVGYSREELIGRSARFLHPSEADFERTGRELHDQMARSGLGRTETTFLRKDGKRIHVLLNGAPLDPGRPEEGYVFVALDVTARREEQERIKLYARRLSLIHRIDSAVLGAESVESAAQTVTELIGAILPCVRASLVLFDMEKGEAETVAVYSERFTELGASRRFPLSEYGYFKEYAEGRTRSVEDLEALPAPSPLERRVWEEGIRSYLGVPLLAHGDLIGALNIGADRPRAYGAEEKRIARELADQMAIAIYQVRLRRRLEASATRLEQRVKERTAELARANEELKAFAFAVSHDLRAPLRHMAGFAQALAEDYASRLDERGREWVNRIVESSQRMDRLIRKLLEYSRLQRREIQLRPVSLETAAEQAIKQLEGEIAASGAEILVDRPLPPAHGEPVLVTQILTNLLSNAIKFVAPGTRPQARLRAESFGAKVRLWVEDNGIGIAPENCDKIFRIFERLHGVEGYPGLGVGLAFVAKAAERMGGRCGVESKLGKGSRFWVEFEAAASAAEEEQ